MPSSAAAVADRHPQRQFAARGVRDQEESAAAGPVGEDLVHRAVCERHPPVGIRQLVLVERRGSVARSVEGDRRETLRCGQAQQRQSRMARTVEVRRRRRAAVDGDDHRARIVDRGDERRHRHAVDHDDARAGIASGHIAPRVRVTRPTAGASRRSGSGRRCWRPRLGRRRPAARPPRPRSWVTASWIRPMPWVRPWDSWPPWVFSGMHAVARDVLAAVEEVLGLADAAEAEPLEPRQAVEA